QCARKPVDKKTCVFIYFIRRFGDAATENKFKKSRHVLFDGFIHFRYGIYEKEFILAFDISERQPRTFICKCRNARIIRIHPGKERQFHIRYSLWRKGYVRARY